MGDARYFKKGDDGIPVISPSQVNLILTCPQKWYQKYVVKLPDPSGLPAAMGSTMHEALEDGLKRTIEGEKLTADEVGQTAYDLGMMFFGDPEKVATLAAKDREEAYTQHVKISEQSAGLAKAAWGWFLGSRLKPIAVERPVSRIITYLDIKIRYGGRLDFLAKDEKGRLVIEDWKSSKKAASRNTRGEFVMERPHIIQQLGYARCLEEEGLIVHRVGTIKVTKQKIPQVCPASIEVTPGMKSFVDTINETAIRTIYDGNFSPNPVGAGYLCAEAYCPAYHVCPGSSKAITQQSPEENSE